MSLPLLRFRSASFVSDSQFVEKNLKALSQGDIAENSITQLEEALLLNSDDNKLEIESDWDVLTEVQSAADENVVSVIKNGVLDLKDLDLSKPEIVQAAREALSIEPGQLNHIKEFKITDINQLEVLGNGSGPYCFTKLSLDGIKGGTPERINEALTKLTGTGIASKLLYISMANCGLTKVPSCLTQFMGLANQRVVQNLQIDPNYAKNNPIGINLQGNTIDLNDKDSQTFAITVLNLVNINLSNPAYGDLNNWKGPCISLVLSAENAEAFSKLKINVPTGDKIKPYKSKTLERLAYDSHFNKDKSYPISMPLSNEQLARIGQARLEYKIQPVEVLNSEQIEFLAKKRIPFYNDSPVVKEAYVAYLEALAKTEQEEREAKLKAIELAEKNYRLEKAERRKKAR